LKGDGSTKYIDTNLTADIVTGDDFSLGFYRIAKGVTVGTIMGGWGGTNGTSLGIRDQFPGEMYLPPNRFSLINGIGHYIATTEGVAQKLYLNGLEIESATAAIKTIGSLPVRIYKWGNLEESYMSDSRFSMLSISQNLTPSLQSSFSLHTNTLMTALGCNVY
jgi:hypothetical protein